jgi:hypothetical protein
MSVDGAVAVGEKALKDLEARKEADRIAAMTPDEKKAQEAKAAEAAKVAEEAKLLEVPDDKLEEPQRAQKAEIIKAQEEAERKDEDRILAAQDLNEEEQAQKAQILQKRAEQKEADRQAKIDQRFAEITGELKAERNARTKDQEKIKALENELKALKEPGNADAIYKAEEERVAKYREADKALPRAERREMDDAELEEWMIEDMVSANRWLVKQERRRERERESDANNGKDDLSGKAEEILQRQAESKARATAKHPELDMTKRMADLKGQGKSEAEIQGIIFKENPKVRTVAEIMREDPDKYLLADNGPELLVEEMERRLKSKPSESQEERDARIAAEAIERERQRIASLPENLRSNPQGNNEPKMSELETAQYQTFKKMFPQKTLADFKALQERRAKNA